MTPSLNFEFVNENETPVVIEVLNMENIHIEPPVIAIEPPESSPEVLTGESERKHAASEMKVTSFVELPHLGEQATDDADREVPSS